MNEDFNVTGNIKTIEWLKVEILSALSSLNKGLLKGSKASKDVIADCIAGMVILLYLLSKRIGIEFSYIDSKVQNKLKLGILEEDEIEKDYGDLSKLLNYIRERK
ncbi:MAG: MazG-like family protein [Clostridiales bacterium]|nr:MazG-like family protein [Clostridiales bacterium]